MNKVYYSWILPIYNEALSLPQLIREISQVMKGREYEIIAVDDGSKDPLNFQIPRLKVIHLNTHQGKWAALQAGFKAASGQIIITSDSDLQDDPKEAKKLLKKLDQGFDLVSGWRKIRFDPLYKVVISRLGNLLVSILAGHHFKDLNSPFKAIRREVLDSLPKEGSLLRFSLLFAKRLGYKVFEVPITGRPRIYGSSKFGLVKYLRILYDLILVLLLFTGSGRLKKHQ